MSDEAANPEAADPKGGDAVHQPFFRRLPQPALVCRVERDASGAARDLIVVDVNDAIQGPPGTSWAAHRGSRVAELFGPAFLAPHLPIVDEVLAVGRARGQDALSTPDGRWYASTVYPVGPDLVAVVALDITERRIAEEALAASEARYRSLLDDMTERVQILDRDWRWAYVNRAALDGPREELAGAVGRSIFEVYPGFAESVVFQHLRSVMDERLSRAFLAPFTYRDGTTRWYEFRARPVPEGVFILSVDVTERHLDQELLRASAERLRRTTEALEEAREIAGLAVWRDRTHVGAGRRTSRPGHAAPPGCGDRRERPHGRALGDRGRGPRAGRRDPLDGLAGHQRGGPRGQAGGGAGNGHGHHGPKARRARAARVQRGAGAAGGPAHRGAGGRQRGTALVQLLRVA